MLLHPLLVFVNDLLEGELAVDREPELDLQGEHVGLVAGEDAAEATALGGECGVGAGAEDPVRVGAQQVVLGRVKLRGLHLEQEVVGQADSLSLWGRSRHTTSRWPGPGHTSPSSPCRAGTGDRPCVQL